MILGVPFQLRIFYGNYYFWIFPDLISHGSSPANFFLIMCPPQDDSGKGGCFNSSTPVPSHPAGRWARKTTPPSNSGFCTHQYTSSVILSVFCWCICSSSDKTALLTHPLHTRKSFCTPDCGRRQDYGAGTVTKHSCLDAGKFLVHWELVHPSPLAAGSCVSHAALLHHPMRAFSP